MDKTDFETLSVLEKWRWINPAQPSWWDLDYSKDPRELLEFQEFQKRLRVFGPGRLSNFDEELQDIGFYIGNRVPVTVVVVDIRGAKIPLFITARPATYKEDIYCYFDFKTVDEIAKSKPEEKERIIQDFLRDKLDSLEPFSVRHSYSVCQSGIPLMYFPHVRGFFKEIRGNRFFYYPLDSSSLEFDWGAGIGDALLKENLEHILVFRCHGEYKGPAKDRISRASDELVSQRKVAVTRSRRGAYHPKVIDVGWPNLKNIVYDNLARETGDAVSYYPVRPDGMNESVPIAISNRTHFYGKEGLYSLGLFSSYYEQNKPTRLRVIPFVDERFALDVSEKIESELGIKTRPVLLKRTPGRERFFVL